jgi:hypothetical protein
MIDRICQDEPGKDARKLSRWFASRPDARYRVRTEFQPIPEGWRDQISNGRVINGRLCGLQPFMFTTGLMVNLRFDDMTYEYSARYCYERFEDALKALNTWDGAGDPSGPWCKEKVSERLGPGLLAKETA